MEHSVLYVRGLNWLLSGLREKFPSPIQNSKGGRMKQLPTKGCFSLKPSALPMRKVVGRGYGLAATQSQVQRKYVCLFRVCRVGVTSTSSMKISDASLKTPQNGVPYAQAPRVSPELH